MIKRLLTPLLLAVLCASASAATRPPNIVLIFTDDQGYSDLGCFGAEGWTTPNIDRLAEQGIRLTSFYVAQAVCSASRAALLTGCLPNRIGILGALNHRATHGIHPDETTLAEVLKSRGYATGIFGKWHLGHRPEFLPLQHGFDEYLGIPYSNDMWPVDYDGIAIKDKRDPSKPHKAGYPPLPLIDGNEEVEEIWTLEQQGQLIRRYTERAVAFIEKNQDAPFFLYVPHSLPHVPLGTSEAYRGKSAYGRYGEVIMEIDASVGQIVQALETNGLTDQTLVIFTSDNGPWKNYGTHAGTCRPLREGKGTMWEGGCRVPFVARWPGRIPAGSESGKMAATIDILPTLAEISGADLPANPIDGVSIRALLEAREQGAPRKEYAYYYGKQLQAMRQGPWKLHFPHKYRTYEGFEPGGDGWPGPTGTGQCGWELYNLEDDIGETTDVAAEHPAIVGRLKALGRAHEAELRATTRKPGELGFTSLFNRSDLKGWVNVNGGPDTWSVAEGRIHCTGQPISMLRTEKMYQNFVLELEWRHLEAKGNSGVFVWAEPLPAPGTPFLKGIECQILDGREADWHTSQGDVFPTWGAVMTPVRDAPFREISRPAGMRAYPTAERTRPSPRWNHYRITCVDGAIDLAVNGEVVTRGLDCTPRKGYIALESEGAPVDFRNVRIKELPDTPLEPGQVASTARGMQSLFNGVNLDGWTTGNPDHWQANGSVLAHDGKREPAEDPNLWTTRSFRDFELMVDWRFPFDAGQADLPMRTRPEVAPDGGNRVTADGEPVVQEVVDFDSGIYLRGDSRSQINIWCWPSGSGEVWGYRTDPAMPAAVRAACTPKINADHPVGKWNRFHITLIGDRLTVLLNGQTVIENAHLPGIPEAGPIALQHHGNAMEFTNLFIRELNPPK